MFEPDLIARIKEASAESGQSMSEFIRRAIEAALTKKPKGK